MTEASQTNRAMQVRGGPHIRVCHHETFFLRSSKNVIFHGACSDKDDWRLNFCKIICIHLARADFQNAYSITLATLAPPVPHVTADFASSVSLHLCLQNVIIEGKLDKNGINFEQ